MLKRCITQILQPNNKFSISSVPPSNLKSKCTNFNCINYSTISQQNDIDTEEKTVTPTRSQQIPLMTNRTLYRPPFNKKPKQAWLESLNTIQDEKIGMIDLHPDIFGSFPRLDMLWWNILWQTKYKKVNYDFVRNRSEMPGGGRKPWPQKGTGRARHGSIRSPLWIGGGKTFGPRGPRGYFFMLPKRMRILGLRTALSCKYAQNNFHVVDKLEIPSDQPTYLEELIETRGWGLSVLFINDKDILDDQNFADGIESYKQYNVMPVYGLNVYSLLKFETVVFTLNAIEIIEKQLLSDMHSPDFLEKKFSRVFSW